MWDLWQTKWHWDAFFSEYIVVSCQCHSTIAAYSFVALSWTLNNRRSLWRRYYTLNFIFFFFFFSRRYNPWWILACFTISFHNLLSLHFSLQFLTLIFFKSFSTWSSHLNLGLPTGLDERGSHSVNFSTVNLYHWR